MTKKITRPVAKTATKPAPVAKATPAVAKPTEAKKPVQATTPAAAMTPAPSPATEQKKIDLNKPEIKDAIAKGKALIKEGKSKADAAMVIYEALKAEDKEVIAAAFVQGADLTAKGSVTYFYNCRRKSKKEAAKPA
jgi:hypothetical protein